MKLADLPPRRIPAYEFLQVPIRESLPFTLNMYGAKGWRMIDKYEVTSHNHGAYADPFVYIDGYKVNCIGKYQVVLLEREIHEFRTLT